MPDQRGLVNAVQELLKAIQTLLDKNDSTLFPIITNLLTACSEILSEIEFPEK